MKKEILEKLHNTQIEILNEINKICIQNNIQYFLTGGTLLGAVRHNGFIPWDDDLDIAMPRKDYEKFLKIANEDMKDRFILDSLESNKLYWAPFGKIRIKNSSFEEETLKNYDGNKGIFVDIFPLDNAKNEYSLKQKINYKTILICRYIIMKKRNFIRDSSKIKKIVGGLLKIIPESLVINIMNNSMKLNKMESYQYFINYGSQYGIKKQTHLKEWYYPATKLEFEGTEYFVPKEYKKVLKKIYGETYMELPPIEKRITHNPLKIKFEDGEEYIFKEEGKEDE